VPLICGGWWFVLDNLLGRGLFLGSELFSLMSAPSDFEPHPSLPGMRVRLSFAVPVISTASTLMVRPGHGMVLEGGLFRHFGSGGVTPG
jgi:hypothetical protein